MAQVEKSVKLEDYFICRRCKISSITEGRMCPCPRRSCEAYKAGTAETVIKINLKS